MNERPLPLVSVVMCVYNGGTFLREQLDSVINQTYPNIELIILDDLSTDNSFAILKSYARQSDKIQLIQNENNLGFNRNFEKGIALSKGAFISICDQDDIWYPEKIEALVNNIGSARLIYSNSELIDEKGDCLNRTLEANLNHINNPNYEAFLDKNVVTGHTCLFARNLMEHIFPLPPNVSFYDKWIALVAAYVGEVKYLDRILTKYRIHDDSVIQKLLLKDKAKKNRASNVSGELLAFSEKCFVKDHDKVFIRKYFQKKSKSATGVIPSIGFYIYLLKHHNKFYPSYSKTFIKKLNYIRKQCL